MPNKAKRIGYFLILLGLVAYFGTGMQSLTALIPAFFGLAFTGLGSLAANKESMRKHAMHTALLLAVLGIAGSVGGILDLFGLLGGTALERPAAAISQALMFIVCLYFVIAGIKSFKEARKAEA